MSSKEKNLSILSHFSEMRTRLIRSVIVLVITAIVSFVFYDKLFEILLFPAPEGIVLQAVKLTEMMGATMRVSLFAGIILAVPYFTWELIMFVSPALTSREKKYVYITLPWIAVMFAGGVAFAYFVLVPRIVGFLLGWGTEYVQVQPLFSDYVNIVTRLLLVCGLVFELPVLTTFLSRLGVLKPHWLSSRRKHAIVISFILAAIITPTIDPINQCLIAAPLIVLYELSIWLSKLVYRKKKPQE